MDILRTPDERFRNLPGYSFSPNYLNIPDGRNGQLRIHYVDEGPRDGQTVLLMHGEPSWSYLYRKMIPPIAGAGLRVVAPDLVGFGRSDKPAHRGDYTYQRHVDWMLSFLQGMHLEGITLVCQDWGGLVGLRLVSAKPDRFARVVVANTGLPTGDHPMSDAFLAWRRYSQETPDLHIGGIIKGACVQAVPDNIIAAYDAPFPDDTYKEGARIFPSLVPITADDPSADANRRAWQVLSNFRKPFLTAFSDGDPITRGGEKIFQNRIPGAQGQPHTTIKDAGHFLQEDQGEEFARAVIDFIRIRPA